MLTTTDVSHLSTTDVSHLTTINTLKLWWHLLLVVVVCYTTCRSIVNLSTNNTIIRYMCISAISHCYPMTTGPHNSHGTHRWWGLMVLWDHIIYQLLLVNIRTMLWSTYSLHVISLTRLSDNLSHYLRCVISSSLSWTQYHINGLLHLTRGSGHRHSCLKPTSSNLFILPITWWSGHLGWYCHG